jgi:hypothetical protein
MGIEPTLAAWEAAVLPLNYTRLGASFYCVAYRINNCRSVRLYGVSATSPDSEPTGLKTSWVGCRRLQPFLDHAGRCEQRGICVVEAEELQSQGQSGIVQQRQ